MSGSRSRWLSVGAAAFAAVFAAASLAAQAARPPARVFYAPKPVEPAPYDAPMRPLVRLAELKARHKGQPNWSELVVDDKNNRAQVISASPGSTIPRHLHSDSPEYWMVQEGRIRFQIEDATGQLQTFEAGKGDLILAPERRLHSLEVIGTVPAIRYQVTLPDTTDVFEAKPAQPERGMVYTPVTLSTGNNPDEVASDGKPEQLLYTIDQLQKEFAGRRSWSTLAVRKNRAHANIICGYGADVKPVAGDLGHYHTDFAEMWVIMRGQQRFTIEGLAPFVADEGDVVYAPAKRWHLPQPSGEGMSCRLAMTPYPAGNHLYQPKP
jgi:mannose-6-phosphate isomerase-like protein (cupin superfamily)